MAKKSAIKSKITHKIALLRYRHLYVITSAIAVILIVSGGAYAYRSATGNNQSTAGVEQSDDAITALKSSPSPTPTSSITPSPTATVASPIPSSAISKSAESPKQSSKSSQTAPVYSPPPAPVAGPRFSTSSIRSAYTSCQYGSLQYTIGGIDIYSMVATTTPFSWRLEVSDGTIFESDTDTMPSGSSSWFSFPSTPSYPAMIGTIQNANDGDKVRFVITSPNYFASAWTNPIAAGSEEACRSGRM